jgi:hypothetical protein
MHATIISALLTGVFVSWFMINTVNQSSKKERFNIATGICKRMKSYPVKEAELLFLQIEHFLPHDEFEEFLKTVPVARKESERIFSARRGANDTRPPEL